MDIVITAGLLFAFLAAFVLPFAALAVLKVRTGRGLLAALMGAGCFFVFAFILEQLLHMLVVPLIHGNTVLYCTYGCLAAGVFEETARLLGLSILCKKDKSLATGIGYGIGHGGIEAVSIVGVNSLVTLISYATGGDTAALLNATYGDRHWQVLLSGAERLSAMALHMALSILIWLVVTKRIPFFFYFIAIILHALADVPAAVAQTMVFYNITVVEIFIAAASAAVCIIVKIIYDKSKKETTADETDLAANQREDADVTAQATDSQG